MIVVLSEESSGEVDHQYVSSDKWTALSAGVNTPQERAGLVEIMTNDLLIGRRSGIHVVTFLEQCERECVRGPHLRDLRLLGRRPRTRLQFHNEPQVSPHFSVFHMHRDICGHNVNTDDHILIFNFFFCLLLQMSSILFRKEKAHRFVQPLLSLSLINTQTH